jgi:hypothetical protein
VALTPADVGIILSYRCQAACRHCLYNCGPTWQDWMSRQQVQDALEAVLTLPQPVQVHLTGGEPFLRFDLLLEAVGLAAQRGIPCYVETNAGWCVREELVVRRLIALRDAGMQVLLISCSPFHAETIPPARTRLGLTAALEVLGPERVILYLPEWLAQIEQFGAHHPTSLEQYVEILGEARSGRLFWEGYGLIAGGRSGDQLGHWAARRPASAFQGWNCRQEILYARHSHMDLYGNYISGFCGGLTVGDWHDLPRLRTDVGAGRVPPLVKILIRAGPYGLYEWAREDHAYQPLPEGYAGKCHLCVDVRRTLVQRGEFQELRPQGFYDAF